MYTELLNGIPDAKSDKLKHFLRKAGLELDLSAEKTVLIWDEGEIIATASRYGNILKCIAVDEKRQGEGLVSKVITELKNDASSEGIRHLFIYTKPENRKIFTDLFFYPIAETEDVLLLENKKHGITDFVSSLSEKNPARDAGCIVMNCNPFTLGHKYLIETASKKCRKLYVFVVSENRSKFSFADRIEMVRRGTSHIDNVVVLETGPYLISTATFPTYFLNKNISPDAVKCRIDIKIFNEYFVPHFGIKKRFVGTEPFSGITNEYNKELKRLLPEAGIELIEVERMKFSGVPISASEVRGLIDIGETEKIKSLVSETTYNYLVEKSLV